jgi:hypothetical protein
MPSCIAESYPQIGTKGRADEWTRTADLISLRVSRSGMPSVARATNPILEATKPRMSSVFFVSNAGFSVTRRVRLTHTLIVLRPSPDAPG